MINWVFNLLPPPYPHDPHEEEHVERKDEDDRDDVDVLEVILRREWAAGRDEVDQTHGVAARVPRHYHGRGRRRGPRIGQLEERKRKLL